MISASRTEAVSTVCGLSDDQLLEQTSRLANLDHQVQVFVIDHLCEIENRHLYLERGFSSLFDYVKRGLGYSDGATWRRISAMKLSLRVEGVRERLRDGSLTLDAAAQLQGAFERRERERAREARSAGAGPRAAVRLNHSAPALRPAVPKPAPVLDASAQKALVEQAVGKSTRQVMQMLADVDPALAVPADRMRALGEGRWELKAVIDAECQRGLEQLRGLLSHVDPHMTLGQLVGRLVEEGLDRHDPGRPRRVRRPARRPAGAEQTSAPKLEAPRGEAAAPTAKRSAMQADTGSPAADTKAAPAHGAPAGRAIPAAVKREILQRAGGRCRYVDPRTGRRCASRHLMQIDHVLPYSLGGAAEPDNLRLLCAAHNRHRHAERPRSRDPAD